MKKQLLISFCLCSLLFLSTSCQRYLSLISYSDSKKVPFILRNTDGSLYSTQALYNLPEKPVSTVNQEYLLDLQSLLKLYSRNL